MLFSDCHRGTGGSNDNFLPNQTLYLAALQHYYNTGYTYIELGDGDELWENRGMKHIMEMHGNVFEMLYRFQCQNRLHMLYGNHDCVKSKHSPIPKMPFHAGIILENTLQPNAPNVYLTHGHQAELLNSTLWPLARFLVRYLWKPLERFGILNISSPAKNYRQKAKTERRLQNFAQKENHILIAGHTHRPLLSDSELYYCNCGSCTHPYSITCLEICHGKISLIKWSLTAGSDMSLHVLREVLSGPFSISLPGSHG